MADYFGAANNLMFGIIGVLVVSAFIVAAWPQLSLYLGNAGVFSIGSIVLFVIAILPLAYLFGVAKRSYREISGDNDRGGVGGFG